MNLFSSIFKKSLFASLALASSLFAIEDKMQKESAQENPLPYFTGPLLASSALINNKGVWSNQPYLYVTYTTGAYNSNWSLESATFMRTENVQYSITRGMTDYFDLNLSPQSFTNTSRHHTYTGFGDLPSHIAFQLLRESSDSMRPNLKLYINETFPTGKYDNLNPNRHGTDSMGAGTFATQVLLAASKVFHIQGEQFFKLYLNLGYTLNTQVDVQGFNAYGGGYGTSGTIRPGDILTGYVSFEYSFTQNWAFAMDIKYVHANKTTFSGTPGTSLDGSTATVGSPSSESISFAPAIEYGVSKNVGFLAGVWVSGFGRNSPAFTSAVVSCTITY